MATFIAYGSFDISSALYDMISSALVAPALLLPYKKFFPKK